MSRAASQAVEIKRVIRALESVGKCVTAVKCHADGGFELLTANANEAVPATLGGQWGDDAGAEEVSRA